MAKRSGSKKRMNNIEAVRDMMDYSAYGPLAQLFVMQAIEQFADKVIDHGIVALRKEMGNNSFVSPEGWHGVAEEIKQKLNDHFGR